MAINIQKSKKYNSHKIVIIVTEHFTFDYYIAQLVVFCSERNFLVLGKFSVSQIKHREKLYKNVEFKNINITRRGIGFSNLFIIFKIYKILKSENFAKVITIMPKANILGQIASKLAYIKHRIVILTGNIWYDKKGIKRIMLKFIESFVIFLSTKTLADSKSQSDLLKHIHPNFLKNRIFWINSISPGQNSNFRNQKFLKNSNEIFKVGHFGRISLRKGSDDAIKIGSIFLKNSKEGIFIIAGPIEDQILNKQISELIKINPKRAIVYEGFFDIYEMLSKIDILLMPSIYEGYGITAIEASKTGTLVLGYDVVGLKDSIIDNVTGLKVPYRNWEKMIEILSFYEKNRKKLYKFQEKSYKYSLKAFTSKRILGALKKELNI